MLTAPTYSKFRIHEQFVAAVRQLGGRKAEHIAVHALADAPAIEAERLHERIMVNGRREVAKRSEGLQKTERKNSRY